MVNTAVSANFYNLAILERQQTEEVALSLKQEQIASEAILGLTSAVLKEIKKLTPKSKQKDGKGKNRVKTNSL